MKVVLIGFMGSGKSAAGEALARKLGVNFIDMDFMVLNSSGLGSIPEIFETKGEKYFRNLETEVAEELGEVKEGVVATGGGVVMKEETIKALKQNAKIVYLKVSFEEVLKRIPDKESRPLLKDLEKAKKLYQDRQPLYEEASDITVETEGKTIEEIVGIIFKKLK